MAGRANALPLWMLIGFIFSLVATIAIGFMLYEMNTKVDNAKRDKKKAESVKASENIDVEESDDESVGIFKPKQDERNYYPQDEYKFDE